MIDSSCWEGRHYSGRRDFLGLVTKSCFTKVNFNFFIVTSLWSSLYFFYSEVPNRRACMLSLGFFGCQRHLEHKARTGQDLTNRWDFMEALIFIWLMILPFEAHDLRMKERLLILKRKVWLSPNEEKEKKVIWKKSMWGIEPRSWV